MSATDDLPPDLEDDMEPPPLDEFASVSVAQENGGANGSNASAEERTLMDDMIETATVAKKKKEEKKAMARKKADKTFGKGLKKGFFNTAPKKKSNKPSKKKKAPEEDVAFEITTDAAKKIEKKEREEIPFIKAKKKSGKDDPLESLRLPEVQAAMKNTVSDTKSWMTPELMQRFAQNPKLAMGMANPRFVKAMGELQENPEAAMEKYKNDAALHDFLNEFTGLMGDHMTKLGENQKEKEEKELKQKQEEMRKEIAKNDPEVAKVLENQDVASILADPEMQRIMQECTKPGVLRKYMSDPTIAKKFRILQQHGLIQIQGF
jgi:hypothetical protein